MKTILSRLLLSSFILAITLTAAAQPLSTAQIDALVERTLKTFNVPGIAVGVVKDGKLIHAKGYGIANLSSGKKVDEHTLFGVASNSKAFTTASRFVFAPVYRMASAKVTSGISIVVFMDSKYTEKRNPASRQLEASRTFSRPDPTELLYAAIPRRKVAT